MSLSNNNNERKQFAFDLNVKPVEDDNSDFSDDSDLCTICLEPNTRDDRRTIVTLTCGHNFHLDCIGSAFNAKGFMQCPNCMQIEPGQWRYAADPPIPNISRGNRIAEEDNANSDRAQQFSFAASVHPYFSSHRITAMGEVQQRAPPSQQLTWRTYLSHPSFQHTSSVSNDAPLFPPYPNTSAVNRIPSVLGDLSAPVSGGHMFSSGTEQVAGEISHSWTTSSTYVRPSPLRSNSRASGTSVDDGDGIGVSSSNGGRGRGGNGDRNGISGGSHLRVCRRF